MKILFLTPFYFDLHKPILSELEKQAGDVFVVEDKQLPIDPNRLSENYLFRRFKSLIRKLSKIEIKYWAGKIANDPRFNESYDLLICINGSSFHPYLLDHLRNSNPRMKTILYLWDSVKYYNFLRYKGFFDRILTFDIEDCEKIYGVELLHSYWLPTEPKEVRYKLLSLGSDHDDRMDIISKVYLQLQRANISSYIKVVISKPKKMSLIHNLLSFGRSNYKKEYDLYKEKIKLPFTSVDKVSLCKVMELIDESECVLDTDKPIQTGVTQRVIWALARGKKVISTNCNIKRLPFYNPEQIIFIDRKNPVIDIDFLKNPRTFPVPQEIMHLRVDKWIHRLIDF